MPPHADPDDLALLALGERPEGIDDAHLAHCSQCQTELDQLRAVVTTARDVQPADQPEAPPARVWDRIADELELTGADDDAAGAAGAAAAAAAGGAGSDTDATVTELRPRSRRGTVLVAAAAALLGIVLGAGVTAALNDDDSSPDVVASTQLEPLPKHSGSGDARIVGTGADRALELDVADLTQGDGFYEVWLLGADGKRLVSLGLLDGTTARFPLPPEVDVSQFPVVDVSLEPADGNPAHSGDSIVRGTLQT